MKPPLYQHWLYPYAHVHTCMRIDNNDCLAHYPHVLNAYMEEKCSSSARVLAVKQECMGAAISSKKAHISNYIHVIYLNRNRDIESNPFLPTLLIHFISFTNIILSESSTIAN